MAELKDALQPLMKTLKDLNCTPSSGQKKVGGGSGGSGGSGGGTK
jgi:hypothetical protein